MIAPLLWQLRLPKDMHGDAVLRSRNFPGAVIEDQLGSRHTDEGKSKLIVRGAISFLMPPATTYIAAAA